MSIKTKYLHQLKEKFLLESTKYKTLCDRREKILREMKRIIQEDSLSGISEEELKILRVLPGFWYSSACFYPGANFRDYFGGPEKNYQIERYYDYFHSVTVEVPASFSNEPYGLRDLPKTTVSKLLPLNNELLEIEYKKYLSRSSWERLINSKTSKVWLKNNFPIIYEKLRELEKGLSI